MIQEDQEGISKNNLVVTLQLGCMSWVHVKLPLSVNLYVVTTWQNYIHETILIGAQNIHNFYIKVYLWVLG